MWPPVSVHLRGCGAVSDMLSAMPKALCGDELLVGHGCREMSKTLTAPPYDPTSLVTAPSLLNPNCWSAMINGISSTRRNSTKLWFRHDRRSKTHLVSTKGAGISLLITSSVILYLCETWHWCVQLYTMSVKERIASTMNRGMWTQPTTFVLDELYYPLPVSICLVVAMSVSQLLRHCESKPSPSLQQSHDTT